ncbi:hypothetical protein FAZ95_25635 [Trinickia violacea]|uniref:Uncharacterized protein n=1 Tax=Trinickia violacea TaxID=2571746 RepID=A0A4P8ITJ5_9BURK|nr:hypothetical protein FAZ95_25635 [Trinickia violacea]
MNPAEMSLRLVVEKWLASTLTTSLRITRFTHARCAHGHYVRVEASRLEGIVALCFFQHADGAWRVFPPYPARPTIRPCLDGVGTAV